jgi:hypothetical protein
MLAALFLLANPILINNNGPWYFDHAKRSDKKFNRKGAEGE